MAISSGENGSESTKSKTREGKDYVRLVRNDDPPKKAVEKNRTESPEGDTPDGGTQSLEPAGEITPPREYLGDRGDQPSAQRTSEESP